ncbi:MAG: hypothetical protein ACTHOD_09690 [Motilibacteraceae bacterium]
MAERQAAVNTEWVIRAFNVGIAAGTALAGALVDGRGLVAALLVGVLVATSSLGLQAATVTL